jgi:hypothetical protein
MAMREIAVVPPRKNSIFAAPDQAGRPVRKKENRNA